MNQIDNIMALADRYAERYHDYRVSAYYETAHDMDVFSNALRTAIEQALAVQSKQEPVANARAIEVLSLGEWVLYPLAMAKEATERGWPVRYLVPTTEQPHPTAPQPHPEKRPQNCGTVFCSCIECPYPDHFPDAGKMIEPFGYFRSTLGGWEDCAETDEGARPLYEAPQPDHFADVGKPMEREWVDLPPEEIKALANLPGADRERTAVEMAYAVQNKLREKNT